jgi:hypothetical protein
MGVEFHFIEFDQRKSVKEFKPPLIRANKESFVSKEERGSENRIYCSSLKPGRLEVMASMSFHLL